MASRPNEAASAEPTRYGAKVRALRRREALNQVQLAEKLGISPSYLNLIENNRRPLPANLLIRLAQLFDVDVHAFATDEDTRLVADLTEAFADPLFEERDLTSVDIRELTAASPNAARAVLSLYRAFQAARTSRDDRSIPAASTPDLTHARKERGCPAPHLMAATWTRRQAPGFPHCRPPSLARGTLLGILCAPSGIPSLLPW